MTIVPFTTPNFYLNVEFDWIPFYHWITMSIALNKLHNKMSTEYLHLTANEKGKWAKRANKKEKGRGLIMPENGRFPCGIDDVWDPCGRCGQEDAGLSRRGPNSHKDASSIGCPIAKKGIE